MIYGQGLIFVYSSLCSVYSSFFSIPLPFPFIPTSCARLFSSVPFVITRTHTAANAEPTSCTTVVQATPQIWILTLPRGARGNASIHSMYPGTHPRGTQNKARFANQNCKKKRRPLVRDQRIKVAVWSKVAREAWSVDASDARKYQPVLLLLNIKFVRGI